MAVSTSAFLAANSLAQADPQVIVIDEFPLSQPDAALIVPVVIGDKTYRFTLDTSILRSQVDITLRSLLGREVPQDAQLAGEGDNAERFFEAPPMSMGKLRLRPPIAMACNDFTLRRQVFGEQIDGALGMDVLQELVISIDFDQARLRVLKGRSSLLGTPIRLFRHRGFAFVLAELADGGVETFRVETGQNGPTAGTIRDPLFVRLTEKNQLSILGRSIQSVGGSDPVTESIGRTTLALTDGVREVVSLSKSSASTIGLGYFSRYRVTFDFPENTVYLRPGEQYNRPVVVDQSGLHILRIGGETVVYSVDPQSPADTCGIRANDRLLSIDDSDVARMTMSAVRRNFQVDSGRRDLLIRRGTANERLVLLIGRGSTIVEPRVNERERDGEPRRNAPCRR